MNPTIRLGLSLSFLMSALMAHAQQKGPFAPENWPASADKNKVVHFVSVNDAFDPLGDKWIEGNMTLLSGGDQATGPIKIGGFDGIKVSGNYMNTADTDFAEWADDAEIDILIQAYGDAGLFAANGNPRNFNFLIGTLPELAAPSGGQVAVEARNKKWNWILFRIPNSERPSDGSRRVGSIPANAQGGIGAGGVNGGTIRLEGVPNLIVRVVAFGEKGAFGEPEQVNVFAGSETCPAEPATNLAGIDVAKNLANHMEVLNKGDQQVSFADGIGPAGDKRRAVRPNGIHMNFAITDGYLGAACGDARSMKVCIEFYDDPALAGKKFGPEAYATDDKGGIGFVAADRRHTLVGSGKWVRRSWVIPDVSLFGVNVAPLTAGPRLIFEDNAPVFVSAFELGIFRAGTHPLAGQDPNPACVEDPSACAYGNFAEMDLATGKLDGLAPGSSGGDQEMIQAEAGPAKDRRMAIRPAGDDGSPQFLHRYLNLAITDEKLGPSSQPGVKLAVCVTYYDDPELTGVSFRPEVYITDKGGKVGFGFTAGTIAVALEGTDKWRNAYFELDDVKFSGVNQGPQAAARFFVGGKVFFSKVAYGVIRPFCPDGGLNPLADCKPKSDVSIGARAVAGGSIRIAWPSTAEGFVMEESDSVNGVWTISAHIASTEGAERVITLKPGTGTARFYRLKK